MNRLLEINGLEKKLGGIQAVKNVTLSVTKGTITCIVGGNGAGKTTLFNLISGYLSPDSGDIFLSGEKITCLSPASRARRGIGRLFQELRLFQNMTVLENLLAARKSQAGEKLINYLFRYRCIRVEEQECIVRAHDLLKDLGLSAKSNTLAQHLSYGQQKLLAFGRLLINDAELFLLDEPFAGISPEMIEVLSERLKKLAVQGKTILMIEHNLLKVIDISDWVFVLRRGEIIYSKSPQTEPQMFRPLTGF